LSLALMTVKKRIACQVITASGMIMTPILDAPLRSGHGANAPIFGTRRFVTDAILRADTDAGRDIT
jgi:hypothetical protein